MIDVSDRSRKSLQMNGSTLLAKLGAALDSPDCGPESAKHLRRALSSLRSILGHAEGRGVSKIPAPPKLARKPRLRRTSKEAE